MRKFYKAIPFLLWSLSSLEAQEWVIKRSHNVLLWEGCFQRTYLGQWLKILSILSSEPLKSCLPSNFWVVHQNSQDNAATSLGRLAWLSTREVQTTV